MELKAYVSDLIITPRTSGAPDQKVPVPDANGRSTDRLVVIKTPATATLDISIVYEQDASVEDIVMAVRGALRERGIGR